MSPLSQADPSKVDREALRRDLSAQLLGEVRFDAVSRALYSTDASVYQIEPMGVVVPRTREDLVAAVRICARHGAPLTLRGGGTSQAGQAVGAGLQVDTSKYLNRLLEVNPEERWARVEPGIVLDELNAALRPHGLRFAPDISTASRATLGGMIGNNSSGARSVLYGKTIDHVLELDVALADGSLAHLAPLAPEQVEARCGGSGLEAAAYSVVRHLAARHAEEIERRFPKVLRRVGGYNLDSFVPGRPFNLAHLVVGSEGTLAVVLEARIRLVPLPKAKAVLAIHFADLLESLAATPAILEHHPAAVEVMDKFILDHTRENPAFERLRQFVRGDPGALLVVEFYGEETAAAVARVEALESDLRGRGYGYHFHRATDPAEQARIWSLREAALGLSMAMKGDAKSLAFVEDTAVAPEKLRDYIEKFLAIVRRHGTVAGVYAHASVGCLHVRPVVNLKTENGVRQFQAIAEDIAGLVLEYGGALSGEHGDGLVRSPFQCRMYGPTLYEAFRTIKRTFDPQGILNPGKIVDAPPLAGNLRYGPAYRTPDPPTWFDFSEYGGMGRAVEMCSGLGACRKTTEGTMCPSYMATLEETHSTRGRANLLRLAMTGKLAAEGLGEEGLYAALDLCLECRACKAECPVGVDMARFKSEFLAGYHARHGVPLGTRALGHIHEVSAWGSRLAPVSNWLLRSLPARRMNESILEIDRRRLPPAWRRRTLAGWFRRRSHPPATADGPVMLFRDTFTDYYEPEIGIAAVELVEAAGFAAQLAPNTCCGRPLISQGLLEEARERAAANAEALFPLVERGRKILFCEPSCLSAVAEDSPALLGGELQRKARAVAAACLLVEEFLEREGASRLTLRAGPAKILLHGHCHQKSMGRIEPARALLARIPGAEVTELDAGCCGMAGSFGYLRKHYEVSRRIGERRLLPAARGMSPGDVLAAAGTSCRHQVEHFTRVRAVHPAILLRSLLENGEAKS